MLRKRLRPRFAVRARVRVQSCGGPDFGLALGLVVYGFSLGSWVLARRFRTETVSLLAFGFRTTHRCDPWPNFCPVGAACQAGSCLGLLPRTGNMDVARRGNAGAGTPWRVPADRAGAAAGSGASVWAGTGAGERAVIGTVSGARTGTGAGKRTGAEAVPGTQQRAAPRAVVEVRAGDGALAGAVLLSVGPGPGWGRCSVSLRRGRAGRDDLAGRLPVTRLAAGWFFAGLLQPLIQLPLGSRRLAGS